MYQAALAKDPGDVHTLSNFGHFLQNVRKDYDRAETMYQAALAKDPGHVPTLHNFGHFLHTVRKDYDRAEAMYQAALAKDPGHDNILYSHADLLFCCLSRTPANVYTAKELLERWLRLYPDHEDTEVVTEMVSNLYGRVLAYEQENVSTPVFKRYKKLQAKKSDQVQQAVQVVSKEAQDAADLSMKNLWDELEQTDKKPKVSGGGKKKK